MAFERYGPGHGGDRPHTMQSVTKSIASLLVGIAIDRGELPGLDATVHDLLPAARLEGVDPAVSRAIRLEDLLTMRSGLAWEETGKPRGSPENDLSEMYRRSRDWIRYVLDRPLSHRPGTTYRYNSGGTLVLGAILESTTGRSVEELAREELFEPLGIASQRWHFTSPRGLAHTGGGLYLAPRDLAKVGRLLLQEGVWGGTRLVSSIWIDASVRSRVPAVTTIAGHEVDYGYLWWVLPPGPGRDGAAWPKVVFARGAEGQFLFVVPAHDLVVVATGQTYGPGENAPLELLLDRILPAFEGSQRERP